MNFVRRYTEAPIGVHILDRRVLSNHEERVVFSYRRLETFLEGAGVTAELRDRLMSVYLFAIFNHSGLPVGMHQMEHKQIYPQAGWVEHDPMEIWARTEDVIKGALKNAGIKASDIAAVGVTNQRETTVVWDKKTGKPYYNAIVWQDTRTDKLIKSFEGNVGQGRFRDKVGLPLATYFSGPKVRWILDNVPEAKAAAERGDAIFGQDQRNHDGRS